MLNNDSISSICEIKYLISVCREAELVRGFTLSSFTCLAIKYNRTGIANSACIRVNREIHACPSRWLLKFRQTMNRGGRSCQCPY